MIEVSLMAPLFLCFCLSLFFINCIHIFLFFFFVDDRLLNSSEQGLLEQLEHIRQELPPLLDLGNWQVRGIHRRQGFLFQLFVFLCMPRFFQSHFIAPLYHCKKKKKNLYVICACCMQGSNSMEKFLRSEARLYNSLLRLVYGSIDSLKGMLQAKMSMTDEGEGVANSLITGEIPKLWKVNVAQQEKVSLCAIYTFSILINVLVAAFHLHLLVYLSMCLLPPSIFTF